MLALSITTPRYKVFPMCVQQHQQYLRIAVQITPNNKLDTLRGATEPCEMST